MMYANIAIKNAKELSTKYPISARIANSNDTTTAGLLGAWIPIFIVGAPGPTASEYRCVGLGDMGSQSV